MICDTNSLVMIKCSHFQVERTDESEDVDIDQSDDEFEEYEWAGQTRVRASSLMLRDAGAAGQHHGCCTQINSL